jgi:hypothetical protein
LPIFPTKGLQHKENAAANLWECLLKVPQVLADQIFIEQLFISDWFGYPCCIGARFS